MGSAPLFRHRPQRPGHQRCRTQLSVDDRARLPGSSPTLLCVNVEDTPMVVRPIAAGPHLIVNYQPGQPHGSPARPGQWVGLTIGGQIEPAAFTHGGRSDPVSLLPFSQHNDAALAAAAALRRLADLIEDAAASQASGNLFRREGEYWTVRYDGSVARLADAKGLCLLARLLADPGREFHAVDLEAASSQTQQPAPARARVAAGGGELQVRPDLGDAGELLDATAKAAYKARLDELQAELDQAEHFGDPGRAATASSERDFLVGELARAVGLGGRDRRAASHAERARLNVTRPNLIDLDSGQAWAGLGRWCGEAGCWAAVTGYEMASGTAA